MKPSLTTHRFSHLTVLVDCPHCGAACKKLPNRQGGVVMIEVDSEGQFLHVHSAERCLEVKREKDRALRAELRALSQAADEMPPTAGPDAP